MHCFSMVFSVVMYGALVSVSELRRLRSCRHIIIIIIIIISNWSVAAAVVMLPRS